MQTVKLLLFAFLCILESCRGDVATDTFSANLLKAIFNQHDVEENTVVSSVSLYDVLALLQQGSGGKSREELTKTLQAGPAVTKKRYSQFVRSLKAEHSQTQLEFANKLYLESGFTIQPKFKNIATKEFQADIEKIKFKPSKEAADTINQWVSDSTHGRIKDIVSSDSLSDDTAMLLLNAVFFAGNWTYQFEAYRTQNSPFTTLNKNVKSVPMMYLNHHLVAGEIKEINSKFVRLPFRGNEFSMIFVVPNEVDGLKRVIDDLQGHLSTILTCTETKIVKLLLPKFKFSTTSKLVPTLNKLGLHDIFGNEADLTGIAPSPPLSVSDVLQKAEIEVDELGATASAATSLGIQIKSAGVHDFEVKADRPFMFFIIDNVNSLPLFSGWVGSP